MKSIKQASQEYEPPKTKNIADLDKVSVDIPIEERTFQDSEGKDFTIEVVVVDGEDYRVPVSVKKALKVILADNKNLKHFKVLVSGEGLKTQYNVVPLEN